ncbi:MAG: hypothetical protein A3H02_02955 [Candidatus Niyogibacteria bacterium RIFCSPLOWO2_12_FULL_41_13]|uniref:Peptidase S74 domain-containing protein n=1 Tax=Candidatus Niyogibacteria bacterium RIFCSPLOWO2_12_FULL_41_13 TaxID=1801726 RepID=A0A1G2F4K2_9BACT|nr:MAG: hypothetical protein A3H02_02955 [Candidatus Niyogibacteria bacterium RIFCSPLOWO2_12_FULL_41_13]
MRIESGGNVGVGTTSPYAKLSVVGQTVAEYFTATSTTATSTIAGGLTVDSNTLVVDYSTNRVGIGTTSPDAPLQIMASNDPNQIGLHVTSPDTDGSVILLTGGGVGARDYWIFSSGSANAIGAGKLSLGVDGSTAIAIDSSGQVGIGTGSPGAQLDLSTDSARKLTTTTWTTGSDVRIKTNIQSIGDGLDIISRVRPVKFNYTPEFLAAHPSAQDVDYYNFIAQEYQQVFPDSVSTSTDGLLYLNSSNMIPYAIAGIKELDQRTAGFNSIYSSTSTPAMYIDALGNIGVGTTSPAYKLHVLGDIAAQSFVNISTSDSKKDISYIGESENEDALNKIKNINIARYRYLNEDENAPLRLGLIAEESPPEILSVSGKGVDIYKLSTFILAGVKQQQKQIENLNLKISDLQARVSGLNGASYDSNSLFALFLDWLKDKIVAVKELAVGSQDKPTGITLYDKATGKPYCLEIVNGAPVSTPGECDSIQINTSVAASPVLPPDTSAFAEASADKEPPVIIIRGNNPAEIQVGTTYGDLGASATDNIDGDISNLIRTFLNGVLVEVVQIDTSTTSTSTVEYAVSDKAGNAATSSRQVIVN